VGSVSGKCEAIPELSSIKRIGLSRLRYPLTNNEINDNKLSGIDK